jgi:8-oxo-dGTP diphosphatase
LKKSPHPTVDIIIQMDGDPSRVVLIKRKFDPPGWALPGGFIDWKESVEDAAVREAKEETCLDVKLVRQFHTYSDPSRDPRGHTIALVFIATAIGTPVGADDAAEARIYTKSDLPDQLAFDHRQVLEDYFEGRY